MKGASYVLTKETIRRDEGRQLTILYIESPHKSTLGSEEGK